MKFPDNSEISLFHVVDSEDESGWYTTILGSTLGPFESKHELFDAVDQMRTERLNQAA